MKCRTYIQVFRERGDPRELLKCINPREAQLADAASGIHVRFRLGGTVFPPLVFYKIFTHRPVTGEAWIKLKNSSKLTSLLSGLSTDICAFCPRDYASETRVTAANVHNKPKHVETPSKKKTFSEDFELDVKFRWKND
jgi:hypothetical protein